MSGMQHLSFRLDHKIDYIIREYATFKQISLSELIRQALLRYIEDDIDPRMFEQAINWERVSTRMADVLKTYNWDWLTNDI
jgi:hypothetical protein